MLAAMQARNRRLPVRLVAVLPAVFILLGACSDKSDEAQRDVQQRIERELADRDDIADDDKAAAAEAIAQDLADVARDSAAIQPEIDAANEQLQQELGSAEELAAQDCDRLQAELDALRRLSANPQQERLTAAEIEALPAETERVERVVAERCGA
jgi:hypothetical protein